MIDLVPVWDWFVDPATQPVRVWIAVVSGAALALGIIGALSRGSEVQRKSFVPLLLLTPIVLFLLAWLATEYDLSTVFALWWKPVVAFVVTVSFILLGYDYWLREF